MEASFGIQTFSKTMTAEVSETLQYREFKGSKRLRGSRGARGGRGLFHYSVQ